MTTTATGVIVDFSQRGFGFLRPDSGERDLFFHCSNTSIPKEKIQTGMRVEYRAIADFRRPGRDQATDVTLVEGN